MSNSNPLNNEISNSQTQQQQEQQGNYNYNYNYRHFQPIYSMRNLRISGIYSNFLVNHFDSICAPFVCTFYHILSYYYYIIIILLLYYYYVIIILLLYHILSFRFISF